MNKMITIAFCLGVGVLSSACTAKDTSDQGPVIATSAGPSAEKAASVEDRIKRITAEQLGVPKERIVSTARFVTDLGADSLDAVELLMAFEEEFGIEIQDAEAVKMVTVGDAVAYVTATAKR